MDEDEASTSEREEDIAEEVMELDEAVDNAAETIHKHLDRPETRKILDWADHLPEIKLP